MQRQPIRFVAADAGEVNRGTPLGDAFDAKAPRIGFPVAAGTDIKPHEHAGFAQRQNVLGIETAEHGLFVPLPAQRGQIARATRQVVMQGEQFAGKSETFSRRLR